jgi:transmembrane sensor
VTREHTNDPVAHDLALARYLSGESSATEARAIEQWIAGRPERETHIEALSRVWSCSVVEAANRRQWPVDRMRAAVRRHVSNAGPDHLTPVRASAAMRWRVVTVAASLVVASALTVGASMVWRAGHPRPVTTRDIATARGQRATIHLADGTTILLDVDSKVSFPIAFDGKSRDVTLRGAAYFDIAHDAERPFRVHAGGAVARDVGTQFGVWAYPDGPVRVVVSSGRVSLSAATGSEAPMVLLDAGMTGESGPSGVRVVPGVDVSDALAWKDGRLKFTNAKLGDVLPQLERWYDVTIIVPTPVRDSYDLTASFRQESTTEALDVLSAALGLPYIVRGHVVQFLDGPAGHSRQRSRMR